MRGYRPSRFRKPVEQSVNDRDRAKRENMSQYMNRVEEGLPLFGEDSPLSVASKGNLKTKPTTKPKSRPNVSKGKSKTKRKPASRKTKA